MSNHLLINENNNVIIPHQTKGKIMRITPRPRQEETIGKAIEAVKGKGDTLIVAATGYGKTIVMASIISRLWHACDVSKVLVLQHRGELVDQNMTKFSLVDSLIKTGLYTAKEKDFEGDVTFAMVQTLCNRLDQIPHLDLVVVDEAHHTTANSYVSIIKQARQKNPALKLIGVTATPNRGDKKPLGEHYSNICDVVSIPELVEMGLLVKPRTFVIELGQGVADELRKVKKTAGEYNMGQVDKILNKKVVTDEIIRHWKIHAFDKKTVVFCSTISHAEEIATGFVLNGIETILITGEDDTERAKKLKREWQVCVNVMVLTEGWDDPSVECVVLLRPSSHHGLYIQMVGRGLRPKEGKEECFILDFGLSTLLHGSLEQEITLDKERKKTTKADGEKQCPSCQTVVPNRSCSCPMCGFDFDAKEKQQKQELMLVQLQEIDILKQKTKYAWETFVNNSDKETYVLSGYNQTFVIKRTETEVFLGVQNESKDVTELFFDTMTGAFKFAETMIDELPSTRSIAKKGQKWHNEMPTEKQLKIMKTLGANHIMPRYRAACMIGLKFFHDALAKRNIKKTSAL